MIDSNEEDMDFLEKAMVLMEKDISVNERLIADIKENKIKVE